MAHDRPSCLQLNLHSTAQEHRAGQIGVLSAAMGVAVTLAQLLDGAVLDAISPLQAFALAATLAAVSLAYTVAAFRETLDRTHATRRSPRSRQVRRKRKEKGARRCLSARGQESPSCTRIGN